MSDLTDQGMRILLTALRKSSLRTLQLPYSMQISTKLQRELSDVLGILHSDWYSLALAVLSAKHRAHQNISATTQKLLETGDIVDRIVRWSSRQYILGPGGFSSQGNGQGRDVDDERGSYRSSSSSSTSGGSGSSSSDTSDEDYESNEEDEDDDDSEDEDYKG